MEERMVVNKNESLDIILGQQQQDNDYLLHIYNRMRAGQSILLTASIAVIVYLYSVPAGTGRASIAERLFIPQEDYGKVIYFIAAGFFIYGVIKLMINVFGSHPWITSYDSTKDNYIHDPEATKEYYKKRNDMCLKENGASYYKHKQELTYLFYSITISAIILVVIKSLN